ncbi:ThuA domain-containing protein [Kallotenue papyrolyticum]|uniref:ThuA domain-containing protein n=1 Tax=Kallotenue papyrolyticum TaxID=1325125 RepID=UPI0004785988|nr:ThuA domain-containing protein [Kallotenue papyrolyticum]
MLHVLVLCADRWHPATTPRAGLATLAHAGAAFDWIEDGGAWSRAQLHRADVVLLTKANQRSADDTAPWMTEQIAAELIDYVQRGRGLLVIHAGLAGYEALPALRRLIGGGFVQHPPPCPVECVPQRGHAITETCTSFTVHDEHYVVALDDPAAQIIAVTRSQHGEQPGGWVRSVGSGRVCALTPGHELAVWQHPAYQRLIRRALWWCAGRDPDAPRAV